MGSGRKQIAFDLDTNQLKKYYPNENWKNAYRDIKRVMEANGFTWRQGSIYISESGISSAFATKVVEELPKKLPWTNICMRDCVITNIGRSFSQNHLFDKEAGIKPREPIEKDNILPMLEDVVRSDKIENDFDFGDEELEK